ncbi:hypothetical protein DYBT9275_02359 [Dyadobacter sp. CECT 9275]|uniref:Signal transduction histidine kinase internal region domain-containing protein n=1 Tax=Dyadobacter helix TaxID=2822344 RepID=A0A916NLC1_9BACT|nr:sensor histidine kinase [Dyadobacter sp. CECT 9275]CAG4999981.1 hypothetical protein DYBT9275_02359 [Dyadobacter sp. CECT 9275]
MWQKAEFNTRRMQPYLFWLGYWLIWILILSGFQQFDRAVWAATVHVGVQAMTAYINILYLIPEFLEKKKYLAYGSLVVVLLIILCRLQITLHAPEFRIPTWRREIRFPRLFLFGRIYLFLVTVLISSTAYKFATDRFKALQRQSEMAKKQLESELQFLKNQINPHFLFNTLNNIYTLAYLKEDNAAPMVMKLSELLRYMLYECQDDRVSLDKEVRFLQNMADMQKLKSVSYQDQIDFRASGIVPEHRIAPLLLLGFLENAFKHSDLDINPQGYIKITLAVDEKHRLLFRCVNTKRKTPANAEQPGGLGLQNVRKRLDLIYPDQYVLQLSETPEIYEVELTLQLS